MTFRTETLEWHERIWHFCLLVLSVYTLILSGETILSLCYEEVDAFSD